MNTQIKVSVRTTDRFSCTRTFKTLAGAQRFAQKYCGETPEISTMFGYAVSQDGVARAMATGCHLKELFPKLQDATESDEAEYGLGYM
jgi:hypothetical protein